MTDSHESIELLLPWHAQGLLEAEEERTVRRHVANCVTCRGQLRDIEELAEAVAESAPPVPDADLSFHELRARLESPASTEENTGQRWQPGPLHWVLLAQAAALLLVVGLLVGRGADPATEQRSFRTLATPSGVPEGAQPRARVLFSEEIEEQAIRRLLRDAGGRIVDGPSPMGLYVIEFAPLTPERSAADRVAALRAHSGVRFAELETRAPVP